MQRRNIVDVRRQARNPQKVGGGSAPPAFSGVLDDISSAGGTWRAAYSCSHRLYSSYTGPLIRVRRASDNAVADIGYDAGSNRLDEAALSMFCSAADGFVVTLYDQGGSARDVTEADPALEPKIYDGATASTVLQGTLPWATQSAAGAGFSRGDSLGISGAVAVSHAYFVAFTTATGARQAMAVGFNSAGQRFDAGIQGASPRTRTGNSNLRSFTAASAVTGSHFYVASIAAGAQIGTATIRQNGSNLSESSVSGGTGTLSVGTAAFSIFRNLGGSESVAGGGCFWMCGSTEWTGGALTALENFGALLSTLD